MHSRSHRADAVASDAVGAWAATDPLRALVDAVDGVTRMPLEDCTPHRLREVARALTTAATRLEGVRARAVAVAERTGAVERSGATSGASWLSAATGETTAAAHRTATLGAAMGRLPALAGAVTAGRVGTEQATALARAADRGVLDDGQLDGLVDEAAVLPADVFGRSLRDAESRTDQRQLRRDERLAHERRAASWQTLDDGTVVGRFRLAAVPGATVTTALDALAGPDTADVPDELRRSSPQRRADALEQLARIALDTAHLPVTATVRPHVTVTVPVSMLLRDDDAVTDGRHDAGGADRGRGGDDGARARPAAAGDALGVVGRGSAAERAGAVGRLPDGTVVSAQVAQRLLCDATVRRLVLDPEGRPVDVGRATRTWSAAQRRAIETVDGSCRGPACDRPIGWTEIHHVRWWRHGGDTAVDNGLPLCTHCHHLVHDDGWTVQLEPATRQATWTSPHGTVVTTTPAAATVHRR